MHVNIVVFSASDLKRRTPSSHNLFDLNLNVSVHKFFQLCRGGSSWVDPELSKDLLMGLAQGHKAVTRVMFEPVTPSVSSQAL